MLWFLGIRRRWGDVFWGWSGYGSRVEKRNRSSVEETKIAMLIMDKATSRQCFFPKTRAMLICLELRQPSRPADGPKICRYLPTGGSVIFEVRDTGFNDLFRQRPPRAGCLHCLRFRLFGRSISTFGHAFQSMYSYAPSPPACKAPRRRSQNVAQRVSTPRTEAIKPKTRVPMSSGPH